MGPFELQLTEFARKSGEAADAAVRNVALEVFSRVVIRSPVLSGRFRANWQLQIDAVPVGSLSVQGASGRPTAPPKPPSIGPGQAAGHVIWIANNLPYARRLEYGYSKQAPQGMVGLTVAEFGQITDQAVAEVRR